MLATIAAGVVLLITMMGVELRNREPIIALRLLRNRLYRSANGVIVMCGSVPRHPVHDHPLFPRRPGSEPTRLRAEFVLSRNRCHVRSAAGEPSVVQAAWTTAGHQPRIRHDGHRYRADALMTGTTSLWWSRLLLFGMGLGVGQVFVGGQAVSFATISPADTGRASTLYNTLRQLGGAIGIALLTTVLVLVDPTHKVNGYIVTNFTAYHASFLVAAAVCVCGLPWALSIRDADAATPSPHVEARNPRNLVPSIPSQLPTPLPEFRGVVPGRCALSDQLRREWHRQQRRWKKCKSIDILE